jgi:tetrahydromethanopterin S-methyltransferase subunit G
MSDGPDNLMLVTLRRLDEKMDRVAADVQEVKTRMTSVEQQVANPAAIQASHYAILSTRLDRIERRLDLVEPAR